MKRYHVTLVFKDASHPDREWTVNHSVEAASAPDAIAATDAWARREQSLAFNEDVYVASTQVKEHKPV